jgi:hypothetical protein
MRYCYFGHHKCASTWFASVIACVCQDIGLSWSTRSTRHDGPAAPDELAADFCIFRNSQPSNVPTDLFRAFHVFRDPRDLVVSAYFSHLNSHPTDVWPELVEIRARLATMTVEEALIWELEFLEPTMTSLLNWDRTDPRLLHVPMEKFVRDPLPTALSIFDHLGLLDDRSSSAKGRVGFDLLAACNKIRRPVGPAGRRGWVQRGRIPAERLLGIAHLHDFHKLAGRPRGTEDVSSHFRKGTAGDWREHFTEKVKDAFKARYPLLLARAGYEAGSDW